MTRTRRVPRQAVSRSALLLIAMLLLPGPAPSRADDNQTAKSESKPDTTTVEFDKKPAEDDAPFAPAAVGVTEDLPEAVTQPFPKSIDDLRTIQEQVRKVRDIAIKTTVGIIAGGGTGSGVLISKDGYVLTAGHVSGQPGRNVTIILPDGKRVRGKTLGANHGVDSGLIKITETGEYDHAPPGERKSAIPLSVLITAPLNATADFASLSQRATCSMVCCVDMPST